MMENLPNTLPSETVETYRSYLSRASLTRELLAAKVKRYIETISQARGQSSELDIGTASGLGAALLLGLSVFHSLYLPRSDSNSHAPRLTFTAAWVNEV